MGVSASASLRPASYTQRRIFEHVAGRPYGDTVARAWRLVGCLDVGALQAALAALARRHETLRTGLVEVDGAVVQRVVDHAELEAPVQPVSRARELTRIALETAESPFDLASPPLARVVLLRIARDDHVLLIVAGHAIWDAVSTRVFARDLLALYAEAAYGVPADVPPVRAQYGDLVATSGDPDPRSAAHWAGRLADASLFAPDRLSRGTARTAPAVAWGRHTGPTATSVTRLSRLAREARSTVGLTLVAGYASALAAVCDVDRLTVALLHANRDEPVWQQVIGYCVDAVLVPFAIDRTRTFRELVEDTTERVFEDYQCRIPVGEQIRLLPEAGGERPDRPAMHELIFNPVAGLGRSLAEPPRPPGVQVTPLRTPKRGYSRDAAWPRATLLVTLTPAAAGGLDLEAEFDPHVLSRRVVADVARTVTAFLELAGAGPDADLRRLGSLAGRRARLLPAPAPAPGRRGWARA